jgi:hypothetical protein
MDVGEISSDDGTNGKPLFGENGAEDGEVEADEADGKEDDGEMKVLTERSIDRSGTGISNDALGGDIVG